MLLLVVNFFNYGKTVALLPFDFVSPATFLLSILDTGKTSCDPIVQYIVS